MCLCGGDAQPHSTSDQLSSTWCSGHTPMQLSRRKTPNQVLEDAAILLNELTKQTTCGVNKLALFILGLQTI